MTYCPNTGAPAAFSYLTPEAYAAAPWGQEIQVFASIAHGNVLTTNRPWTQLRSGLAPLSGDGMVEVLYTRAPIAYERDDGIVLAMTDDLLFAGIQLEEPANSGVVTLAESIYSRLLALIVRHGYPFILRTWNTLQDINQDQGGLERYRQFCLGRHEAITKQHHSQEGDGFPAASAVGSASGGLCVYLLAAKSPGVPVENPRQISAYRYPLQYGPRSPSFSRGLVKTWSQGANLFVSGTASIVGHESRHPGDLAAQVRAALDNLECVITTAEEASGTDFTPRPDSTVLKAYIRHSDDYAKVRALLEDHFGQDMPIAYLRADICRRELLFEIDGVVYVPATLK
jgi:chorismate lyase/3-hydroxybenzoate synthase